MPVSMNDYVNLVRDDRAAGLFKDLWRMNPLLPLFSVTELGAQTINAQRWDELPTGGFRDLYEEPDASTGTTFPAEDKVAIYMSRFSTDIAFDDYTQEVKYKQPAEQQYDMHMVTMDRTLSDYIVNGDINTNEKAFDGIRKRLTNPKQVDATNTVFWADPTETATLDMTASADNAVAGLNQLDKVLYGIGLYQAQETGKATGALLMNNVAFLGLQRAIALSGLQVNVLDLYGRSWFSYRGIPFIDVGLKVDETDIILNNYDGPDATGDATEIYALRLSDVESVAGYEEQDIRMPLMEPGNGFQLIQAGSFKRLGPRVASLTQVEHGIQWQVGVSTVESRRVIGALKGVKFAS